MAAALIALALGGCASAAAGAAGPGSAGRAGHANRAATAASATTVTAQTTTAPGTRVPVVTRTVTFVDSSRRVRFPHRRPVPRALVTVVRYPADPAGPLPLIVFGHGFAVTPAAYWRLLSAWAAAGYVVAAPVFPLAQAHAPGGPDEADLVNQPADMSLVITGMLGLSAQPGDALAGRIDPQRVGVAGQSDGGETALAMAYDRYYLDPRVRAAAILSGAELPGARAVYFTRASPPLLAAQGTADTTNRPHFTYAFFAAAHRPKYLLRLLGAGHLPPYTTDLARLAVVQRVTVAFFDRYLKGERSAQARLLAAGQIPGRAALTADP
ncbi:MAG TPA: hypothetical protein VFN55_00145 [Solirubrobacteraceae bacterium]|nr:hypothetical protein [Solirubrobacteraceae bacterium]